MKNIVITGVSSGIGKSIAEELLEDDYFVIGSVRKESDCEELYKKYPEKFKHVICDLCQPESIKQCM